MLVLLFVAFGDLALLILVNWCLSQVDIDLLATGLDAERQFL
jgi:hypothetical protein